MRRGVVAADVVRSDANDVPPPRWRERRSRALVASAAHPERRLRDRANGGYTRTRRAGRTVDLALRETHRLAEPDEQSTEGTIRAALRGHGVRSAPSRRRTSRLRRVRIATRAMPSRGRSTTRTSRAPQIARRRPASPPPALREHRPVRTRSTPKSAERGSAIQSRGRRDAHRRGEHRPDPPDAGTDRNRRDRTLPPRRSHAHRAVGSGSGSRGSTVYL